jgi:hypothetical protein
VRVIDEIKLKGAQLRGLLLDIFGLQNKTKIVTEVTAYTAS